MLVAKVVIAIKNKLIYPLFVISTKTSVTTKIVYTFYTLMYKHVDFKCEYTVMFGLTRYHRANTRGLRPQIIVTDY